MILLRLIGVLGLKVLQVAKNLVACSFELI